MPSLSDPVPAARVSSEAPPSLAARSRPFAGRSSLRGFLAIGRDWGAIILIAAACARAQGSAWWPLAYVAAAWTIGAFQFSLGEAMLHEASHQNLFATPSWNSLFEAFYALPFFTTVESFRADHMAHHKYLGREGDTIMEDYRRIGLLGVSRNWAWLWFVRPLTGYAGAFYFRWLLRTSGAPLRRVLLFWAGALALVAWSGLWRPFLLYWAVPLVWCFPSYLYWSEIGDHFHAVSGTRSVLNPLSNFVFHNNGYHHLHHASPAIPWFRLPSAHAALAPYGGDVSRGFLDTYRQLRRGEPS